IGGNSASRTSGGIALYRVSDETDFLSGEIFTPEFKSVVAALNPRAIRPMGWVQVGAANFNGESIWANRIKPTALNWGQRRTPPGAIGGTITGTNTFVGPAAPNTPATYTDGEQYLGVNTNANTSASTLDVGGRGAKTIKNNKCETISSAGAIPTGIVAFTYDAICDAWLYTSSYITASVPIEAQIQLANRLRKAALFRNDLYVTLVCHPGRAPADAAAAFFRRLGRSAAAS
ncbi:hypothetical protein, partial [Pseudomonas sp. EA_65y_Pfl1_P113]|uniref:hypothetical protein n=1 Tax=Pseudomonas sp. EA_65y_Pfl1_P113 TaxID=3088692 RepID=UPI0030D75E2C